MKKLTGKQIEALAQSLGAKRIAVENFLASMPENLTMQQQLDNCYLDSRLYKWKPATVTAIVKGIKLAYKEGK